MKRTVKTLKPTGRRKMSKYQNVLQDLRHAENEAAQAVRAVDSACNGMAALLTGRLRSVPTWRLQELKKELRDFNAHTCQWKPLGDKS